MKLSTILLFSTLVILKVTSTPTPRGFLLPAATGFLIGDAVSDHHHKEEAKCNADQTAYMNCLETNTRGDGDACERLKERYNECNASH